MASSPESAGPAPFVYRRRVEFAETDMAGIVHFSMYFRYMEEAEHAMWRAAGLTIAPADSAIGFPRVAAAFDFRRPLRFEDAFEVRLTVTNAGARKIRYEADLVRGDDRIATGTMTMVCVRKAEDGSMAAADIPPDIRTALGI
ncbi:MAG: thioesterase family protein [Vicinamibacterales bacterium]